MKEDENRRNLAAIATKIGYLSLAISVISILPFPFSICLNCLTIPLAGLGAMFSVVDLLRSRDVKGIAFAGLLNLVAIGAGVIASALSLISSGGLL
jgi:hypothetical protein